MSSSLDCQYLDNVVVVRLSIFRFGGVQLSDRRGAEERIRKLFTKIGKYIFCVFF